MPVLRDLAAEGVMYSSARSTALPVTLVSAASLVTGAVPGLTHLLNSDFSGPEEVGSVRSMPSAQPLGVHLSVRGLRLVTLTTVSSVIGHLLNDGSGGHVAVNLGDDGGSPVVTPGSVTEQLLDRFGSPPSRRSGRHGSALDAIQYAVRCLVEWVLPHLSTDVVLLWCAEPDQTQHRFGVMASESRDVLADLDGMLAELWEALRVQRDSKDVELIVCSDHGFSALDGVIDLTGCLVEAGLKEHEHSSEIRVAGNGVSLVRAEPAYLPRLVDVAEWAATQPWTGGIFASRQVRREIDALPIEHLQLNGRHDAPQLALAPRWSSDPNEFGIAGRSFLLTDGRYPPGRHSGHGTLSPHEVHIPLVLWGSRIKCGLTFDIPAGIVDVAPTLLALAGCENGAKMSGRVLAEAFLHGPGVAPRVEREVVTARSGPTTFGLEFSVVGGRQYVNQAWRE